MSLASSDGQRPGRFQRAAQTAAPLTSATRAPQPNTITASQARAARRREARRDEQAVAAWLRELSARPR